MSLATCFDIFKAKCESEQKFDMRQSIQEWTE